MLAILFFVVLHICEAVNRKNIPSGMNPDFFPKQVFDESAPFCQSEREPCGFYSFSLNDRTPFKWIKSWCRCSVGYSCAYEKTDMKMRVYRHFCSLDKDTSDSYSESFMERGFAKKKSENNENEQRVRHRAKDESRHQINQRLKNSKRRKIFNDAENELE